MSADHGFVLHMHPYRETSLIVELFTERQGRLAVIAKGARRPNSALRPVLLQFQPIAFSVAGKGELRTLTRAEWQGGLAMPSGDALIFAFYMNELLVRLLAREDPHPELFAAYVEALHALGERGAREEVLRRFEWLLLRHTGYAPDLTEDRDGRALSSEGRYRMEGGQLVAAEPGDEDTFSGRVLQDIASGRYDAPETLMQAKRLSRQVLGQQLAGVPLKTRQILLDLHRL
jgi:DNA repair protein RecO (recombination protein O)